MYFTYILYSQSHDIFYKGFTTEPDNILEQHNNGQIRFTADKGEWTLMYLKEHATKRQGLTEKRRINSLGNKSILGLINSPDNIATPL